LLILAQRQGNFPPAARAARTETLPQMEMNVESIMKASGDSSCVFSGICAFTTI
jgi:hypothetical protein